MSHPPRILAPALLALAALAPAPVADEAENYRRLQAMPRERRVALAENLERFDKLGPAEQAAIRKLDAEIGRKDAVDQARYRAVLRRYHLWVNGLSDDQKQALRAAEGPEARFNLARKFRLKEREGAPGPRIAGIRIGDYGILGPYEVANLLQVWNKLTAARKAEIEKRPHRRQVIDEIKAQARGLDARKFRLSAAEEEFYDARLEKDEAFRKMIAPIVRRVEEAQRKAEAEKGHDAAKKKVDAKKQAEHPYAEFLYFEDHKPRPVAQKDLERFSASCPSWLHAMLDPLSPDDARDYLTIVYRLLYPHPTEMPAAPKDTRPTTPAPPKAAKKAGPVGPS